MTDASDRPIKFSAPNANGDQQYRYPNCWTRDDHVNRLAIAPARDHVSTIQRLIVILPEPFGVLYVLVLSRRGNRDVGRYQSTTPHSQAEVIAFLNRFRDFFECDGRHALWLMSLPSQAQVIYDQHDCLYAYGPLQEYEGVLRRLGLAEGTFSFPAPHMHHYNAEYDDAEDAVFEHWDWKHFPLQPGDDP